jgi:hypothetical protein
MTKRWFVRGSRINHPEAMSAERKTASRTHWEKLLLPCLSSRSSGWLL